MNSSSLVQRVWRIERYAFDGEVPQTCTDSRFAPLHPHQPTSRHHRPTVYDGTQPPRSSGTSTYWDPAALHDLAYAIVGLGLTSLAWQRVPRVEGVYLGLLWGLILSSPAMLPDRLMHESHHDVLMSLPRMLLKMFPLCTYLALYRRLYPWLTVAFMAGLLVYTGWFLTGGWVA